MRFYSAILLALLPLGLALPLTARDTIPTTDEIQQEVAAELAAHGISTSKSGFDGSQSGALPGLGGLRGLGSLLGFLGGLAKRDAAALDFVEVEADVDKRALAKSPEATPSVRTRQGGGLLDELLDGSGGGLLGGLLGGPPGGSALGDGTAPT